MQPPPIYHQRLLRPQNACASLLLLFCKVSLSVFKKASYKLNELLLLLELLHVEEEEKGVKRFPF